MLPSSSQGESAFARRLFSRRFKCGFAAVAVVTLAATLTGLGAVISTPSPTAAAASGCDQFDTQIRVLILLDTSGSLRQTDPENRRIAGALSAIQIIRRIAEDNPETRFLVAVDTFAASYERESNWVELSSVRSAESLTTAVASSANADGRSTDYREVFEGAVERFNQSTGEGGVCDFMFWFTDGDHDTDNISGILSAQEQAEIDGLCGIGGPVDQLRQLGVDVTALELRVDRVPSQTLRRLVGESGECIGLRGESIGEVVDAGSARELERKIQDAIPPVVDEDFPEAEPTCENRQAGQCEFPFVLSENLEWIKVYVVLTEIENPSELDIRLRPPGGGESIQVSFGDNWAEIANTGMLGRLSSPSHPVIWAHKLSDTWRGTQWGEDQNWVVEFFGPEGEKAAAATTTEELLRSSARVGNLDFDGESLSGVVDEIESVKGDELLAVSTRIADFGASEQDGLFGVPVIVEDSADFVFPTIVEDIISTTQDTDYMSSGMNDEGERVVPIEVSLGKRILYGPFDSWPLPDASRVTTDIVFCSAPDVDVSTLSGAVGFAVERCARPRVLSDPVVTARDSGGEEVRVSVDPNWECQVPAGADGLESFECPELPIVGYPKYSETGDLCLEFRDRPESALSIDSAPAVGSAPAPADGDGSAPADVAAPADAAQPPAVSEQEEECVEGVLLRAVPLLGVLPEITDVSPSDSRFDPTGSISVSAKGGVSAGSLTLKAVSANEVDGEELNNDYDRWTCEVPARADDHECPELLVALTSPEATEADLSFEIEVEALDPATDDPIEDEVEKKVENVEVSGYLPKGFSVSVDDPFDSQGSLRFEIDNGVLAGVFSVEEVKVIPAEGEEFSVDMSEQAPDYECEVEAMADGYECPELVLELLPEDDVIADLEVQAKWQVENPDLEVSDELALEGKLEDVELLVWDREIFLGMILALLGGLLALAAAARFSSAWYRRRWAPVESPRSHSLLVTRGADDLVTTADGSPLSVEPSECAFAPSLGVPAASAVVEGVMLKVGWGSLLAGRAPRIVASSPSGDCRANKGIRTKGEKKVGLVGSSLRDGWVLETIGDRHRLVYWNVPDSRDEAQSRLEELATEIAPHLGARQSSPSAQPPQPTPSQPESDYPFGAPSAPGSSGTPSSPFDERPKAPPGGRSADLPWGDSGDPFGNYRPPA